MSVSECISTRIKKILYERKMTIYKLEILTGISHSTMSCLLNNRYNSCNLKTVFIIIEALGLTIPDFFQDKIFADILKINLD